MKSINKDFLIWFLIILSILGVFDASYLTAKHYLDGAVYCPVGQNCETVLTSEYSTLYGIPVSLFGVFFYLAVLTLSLLYLETGSISFTVNKKYFIKSVFFLSGTGLVISIYFFYLQWFVIKAFCFYCVVSAIDVLLIFTASSFLFAKR